MHARRPARAEPLLALARHLREKGLNEAAMLFVEAGDRLPPATADILPQSFSERTNPWSSCPRSGTGGRDSIQAWPGTKAAFVTRLVLLPEIETGRHEKNRLPLVSGEELLVVYSYDPLRVFRCDVSTGRLEEIARIVPSRRLDHLRGGTQAIPVAGGFLTATHEESLAPGPGRTYLRRFLLIDDGFAPRAVLSALREF